MHLVPKFNVLVFFVYWSNIFFFQFFTNLGIFAFIDKVRASNIMKVADKRLMAKSDNQQDQIDQANQKLGARYLAKGGGGLPVPTSRDSLVRRRTNLALRWHPLPLATTNAKATPWSSPDTLCSRQRQEGGSTTIDTPRFLSGHIPLELRGELRQRL